MRITVRRDVLDCDGRCLEDSAEIEAPCGVDSEKIVKEVVMNGELSDKYISSLPSPSLQTYEITDAFLRGRPGRMFRGIWSNQIKVAASDFIFAGVQFVAYCRKRASRNGLYSGSGWCRRDSDILED